MKVAIVDDHHMVRKGLLFFFKTQTDIEVVGEAANGKEAIDVVSRMKPDVVLMDLSMPDMNGVEATKELLKRDSSVKIVVVTSYADQEHVIPAIQAGAKAYHLKDVEPEELLETIREVHLGKSKLDSKIISLVFDHMSLNEEKEKMNLLTKREADVLNEIAKGKSNKEIASSLFITEKTVKTHVSNLLSKLQLSDRTQAALFAVKYQEKV
ncbi:MULTISPECIES: response regulator [Bacillus]|uniref:LuxR family transcriptional regulator n=1 Tax=Bacillus gobiensis TaxID=1441095 RepID=A0A0M4GD87_9BACI|nr:MULTISPECIES: response regulator transcription factor [Bacillus]ALC84065.1 LuxR family transcriptional regulator [Bacillus gobiensis]MED1094796.1 response regulator transcription factor [Bacillus capparidis]